MSVLSPSHHSIYQDAEGTWFFKRYEDVKLLLCDERFARKPPIGAGLVHVDKMQTLFDETLAKWPVFNDPPEHNRLREIMSVLISPSAMKETRSMIEAVADQLLASLLLNSTVDFIQTFASPLPVAVMNTLLGTSLDHETVRAWSRSFTTAMDEGKPSDFMDATPTFAAMHQYFGDLIIQRKQNPKKDWTSQLINMESTYQLSTDEMISLCIFLLIAAQDNVHYTLGLGMMTLLKNPSQLKLLQENPELVNAAVEEILRFQSPINKLCRWTRENIVIGNNSIPKDKLIVGLIDEANRDPTKFSTPEQFDITRTNNRHLTFGAGGIHHCLGTLLARFELQIALTKLTPHLHRFKLIANEIKWQKNVSMKCLSQLPIKITDNYD